MKTFDPKEKRERYSDANRDQQSFRRSYSRRDDSSSNQEYDTPSEFMKDQRKERHQHSDTESRFGKGSREESGKRRSFNPNFTRDNRLKGEEHGNRWDREEERPRRYGEGRNGQSFRKNSRYNDRDQEYNDNRRDDRSGRSRRNPREEYAYYADRDQEGREGGRGYNGRETDRGYDRNRKGAHRQERYDRGEERSYGENRRGRYGERRNNYGDRREGGRYGDRKKNYPNYDATNYPRFDAPKQTGAIRLNRFIANSGICSRREADDLITAGVVSVNGKIVSELGTKVNPGDEVRFNGEIIRGEKLVYILMNKPKGYVTSLEDPHADKTVMDLIKDACTERVYPVGRLDKNSVGVLLITNDGELTRQLTHPSYKKSKIYQVSLDKALTEEDMQRIVDGIELEDGMIYADEVSYVNGSRKEIGIEIHSGRNRIVRRIFESLGYSVQKLDRVYFAGLTKRGLKRGAWRFLTPKEVAMLKSGEYE